MVLGCFYLTTDIPARDADGNLPATLRFADEEAARLAYELSRAGMADGSRRTADDGALVAHRPVSLKLHQPIEVSVKAWSAAELALVDTRIVTTVGRTIFNAALPPELRFMNKEFKRTDLRSLVDTVLPAPGPTATAQLVDAIKKIGFEFANPGRHDHRGRRHSGAGRQEGAPRGR